MATILKELARTKREFLELERLFRPENKDIRQLVFYVESAIQYRYYEDYFEHILNHSSLPICYLSSDENDPIFEGKNPRIHPFYLKNLLSSAFAKLDCKALVIANPDLNKGAIKRAPDPVHHIYAFRGISSLHQGYRLGAFDHFDSLLCVGQYQQTEARAAEKLYQTRTKELPLVGYPLMERLYRQHQDWLKDNPQSRQKPLCLLAPTWDPLQHKASIMTNCLDDVLQQLAKTDFEVWLRPHPEFIKRFPDKIKEVEKKLKNFPATFLKTQVSSMACLHEADILITDHSTIATDYVLATERPVLFINTPGRIDNPHWPDLGMEPVENVYRPKMGKAIDLDKLSTIAKSIEDLFADKKAFKESVPAMRDFLVANWQKAGPIGGQFILDKVLK